MKHPVFSLILTICIIASGGCARKHLDTSYNTKESEDSCWQLISSNTPGNQELEKALDQETDNFQVQFEQLMSFSETAKRDYETISKNIKEEKPVAPDDLEKIIRTISQGFDLIAPIAETMARNTCWYDADEEQLAHTSLPPLPPEVRMKGVLLELASTITLYDIYISMFSALNDLDRLRQYINHGDPGYGVGTDRLAAYTERIVDLENLATVRENVQKYEQMRKMFLSTAQADDRIAYLDMVVVGSRSYKIFLEMPLTDIISYKNSVRSSTIKDNLNILSESITGNISETFGNLVGQVEERKGKLYQNKEIERKLLGLLQIGDVLLEKTPFRLTDRLIPGYWGHAAIWVGDENDLRSLGLWDHDLVNPYHDQLIEGKRVEEALREGTVLNTLEHFLNIDDLVILRRKDLTSEGLRDVILRTFRQLGKPYDFNFNVETTDKIVCSQLVYIAYPDMSWPTDNIAGRFTISPDNIANQALTADSFEVIELIVDGAVVETNRRETLWTLLANEHE